MKKRSIPSKILNYGFPFIILLASIFSLPAKAQPVAEKKTYTPRYDTIAHKILKLESEATPVTDEMYQLVDLLLDEAKTRIRLKPMPDNYLERRSYVESVFHGIDDILIRHNFIYPRDREEDWTLLLADGLTPKMLDDKTIDELMAQPSNKRRRDRINPEKPFYLVDCDTASFLYLAVGEALKIPISMVDLPQHNFVRWSFDTDSHENWETVYGEFRKDDYYFKGFIDDYDLAKDLYKRRVYLVDMSSQDVLGYIYSVRAFKWKNVKNYKRAIEDHQTSINLYPRSPFSMSILAWIYATCPDPQYRDGKKAVELAKTAVGIYPKHVEFIDALAAAYAESGDFKKAAETADMAYHLKADPWYKELSAAYRAGKTYAEYMQERQKNS